MWLLWEVGILGYFGSFKYFLILSSWFSLFLVISGISSWDPNPTITFTIHESCLRKLKRIKISFPRWKASLITCQMLVPGRCSKSSECKTRLLMSRYQVFHFLQPAEEQHNKFSKPDISSEENCFYSYLSIRPKQFLCPVNVMVDVGLNLK